MKSLLKYIIENQSKKQYIIAGFSGIGKSTFINSLDDNKVVDYDSTDFPKTSYKKSCNYILKSDNEYVIVLSDIDLMKEMKKQQIHFYTIIPNINRKEEFEKMYFNRDVKMGLSKEEAKANTIKRINRWKNQINEIKDFCDDNKLPLIILNKGEYFSDGVQKIKSL